MAETAITTVLSKFGELATREAGVLLQVGDDVMLLRDRLDWLQAFIRDADRKRRAGTDGFTLVWLRQTRNVTFEAEDTLDYFFLKADLESKGYRRWKTWQIYLNGWWSQVISGHLLSGKIKKIKQRLDQISCNQTKYNIKHSPSTIWTPSTTSLANWDDQEELDMEEAHGEEGGRALGKMLDDEEVGAKFISVLGESGSGKFTLVNHFCHKMLASDVKKYEEDKNKLPRVLVWYSMPPGSSTEDLLKQVHKRILKRVGPQNGDSHSQEERAPDVSAKIRHLLDGKRYMMILSGISSITMLNCVSASLPDDDNGSRVVLILEPDAHGVEVARRANALNGNPGQQSQSIFWLTRWTQERTLAVFRKMVTNPHIKGASKAGNKKEDCSEVGSNNRLVNLQTLDIRNTPVGKIDAMFWTIKTLRHVLAENLVLPAAATLAGEMGNLMTLHGVTPGEGTWEEGDSPLHKMPNLRSLELAGLEHEKHGMAMANALRNMHQLGHLKLQGDEISSCVFTEPSLRCLRTVDLHGTVKWADIPKGFIIRHLRPNLVQGNLPRNNEPPQNIQEQLKAYVCIHYH